MGYKSDLGICEIIRGLESSYLRILRQNSISGDARNMS